eukprot:TRINITY_DN10129_c0_g2_i5.p2 TRINITY_DN10129_c0_g2~~TRINITY_DN10129_c0_g2_i5.p2  ORF type:complete len:187 (+),score=50.20 TRINITY_DN10129_c0_g2_i5:139-699(+)
MKVSAVVAATTKGGIGLKGQLPWRLKNDMKHFKAVTMATESAARCHADQTNAVVMGRKTWESIPAKFRPLANRINVVLSRSPEKLQEELPSGVLTSSSVSNALAMLRENKAIETAFVIGGAAAFNEAFASPICDSVYLTLVASDVECDTFIDMKLFEPFADDASFPPQEHEEKELKYVIKKLARSS